MNRNRKPKGRESREGDRELRLTERQEEIEKNRAVRTGEKSTDLNGLSRTELNQSERERETELSICTVVQLSSSSAW